jgi:hypothetical protein
LIKYDSRTTVSKNLLEFHKTYEIYSTKTHKILNKLDKDLIEPISIFYKHLYEKHQDILTEFKNVNIIVQLIIYLYFFIR